MADSLFTVLDHDHAHGRYQPTGFSRGPWSPHALHGGPTAALVAHAAEQVLADSGADARLPVRLTLDLERPVPLAPLTVHAEIVRPGRKVQVAEVIVVDDDGRRLVRASVLAIRRREVTLPDDLIRPVDRQPTDRQQGGGDIDWAFPDDEVAFHSDGTEHSLVQGSFGKLGPATDWIRLAVPVLPDVEPSPFQRVVAAADFLNGISSVVDPMQATYINPDLTVTVHRLPVGEWVAVDAVTRFEDLGIGTAEADLYDEQGRLGRAVQTLLLDPV
ncbi:MAG: thioesterase family protein [Candidatus Microthrix sp.]|nr:thioesterase family protein [Candidatus Microthrix sp.]MBK6438643.1 thioesterase family protein [Candidatus Microthrix sp.]